jgi:flagellar hook-length control protein FliK
MENLPALRERLAEQGLRLERFDVDLSQRDSQQRGNEFADHRSDRQPHSEPRQPRPVPSRPATTPAISTQVVTPAGMQDRRLNVIV